MPLPAIQDNTPSAGYITWPALGMQFMGLSFSIASGNTNQKYLIWKWNGGAPSLLTTNTVPTDLVAEDKVLILNQNGKGSFVDFTDRIFGDFLVDGTVVANAIAANAINATHIEANAISAGHIGANVIQGKHISAGTLTADKLSVGTVSDNLVVNGSFEDALSGSLVGWEVSAMTNGTITPVTGVASSGAVSIQFDATATTANLRLRQMTPQFIPVSSASGRRMYVSARMGVSVATTVGNYLRVNWYDANKVLLASGGQTDVRSNAALTTTFTVYEGQVTPPATARYMAIEILLVSPNVVTKLYLDEVTVHEVTMSTQIGDGQITAAKITTNTITADRIAAGAITVDKLAISDQQNYVRDPGLEYNGAGWTLPTGGTIATIPAAEARLDGTKVMQIVAGGTVRDAVTAALPVKADEWYFASCWVRQTVAGSTTGTIQLGATIDKTPPGGAAAWDWPSFQNVTPGYFPTLGKWELLSGAVKMPAGARLLQLRPSVRQDVATGTYQFDDFQLRRMNGGELIVDGAIYAEKIAANAITANHIGANVITSEEIGANVIGAKHIAANVITGDMIGANVIYGKHIDANVITSDMILANAIGASEIAANAIGANHIFAGAVTGEKIEANAINGKTITGATIRTAETGARVELDAAGLRAYDTTGTEYLTADDDGLTMVGTVIADGMTEGATPQPLQAIMGNWPEGPTGNAPPGLHFKRMDRTGAEFFPRVYSYDGDSLALCSGADPSIPGSIEESYLFLFPELASLDGSREVHVRTDSSLGPGNGYLKIFNGSDDGLTPPDMKLYQTVGNVDIQAWEGNVDVEASNINLTAKTYGEINLNPSQYGTGVHVNGALNVTGTLNNIDVTDAGRTQVTWSGGWTNFGSGYGNLQAKEIMPGVVLLQGMAKAPTTGRTDGMTIATLPVALRPNRIQNMPLTIRTNQSGAAANGPGLVQVHTDGSIKLFCDMTYIVYANFSNSYFLVSP